MEENQQPPIEPTINQEPKKNKTCPLAIAVILALLAAGGVGFGIYELLTANNQTNCKTAQENSEKQEENRNNDTAQPQDNTNSAFNSYGNPPEFDDFPEEIRARITEYVKVQNSAPDDEFCYLYFPTREGVPIWSVGNGTYSLVPTPSGWSFFNSNTMEEKVIKTQSDKIKLATLELFGVDDGGTTLLLINDKDQIEFLHLYSAFENDNFETTVIPDLKDIIRFKSVSHYNKNAVGGALTTLAEDKDGNFYNLENYIFKY